MENAPRYVLRSCVIGLVVGVVATALIAPQGNVTGHAAWIALVFLCSPLLVVAALAVGAFARKGERLQRMRAALLALAAALPCFALVQIPGCAVTAAFGATHVDEAKVWCERLADGLDRWRDEHGAYPESLEGSPLVVDPPQLCRGGLLYSVRDGVFTIDFHAGEALSWASWYMRSDDRVWRYSSS